MRIQHFTSFIGAIVLIAITATSCEDPGKAAKEKATADSIRMADSMAMVQRVADSLASLPKTTAQTAMSVPDLSTLVAALSAAELVEVFNGTDEYTVFAPTNDAFAAVQSTVDMLLQPDNKSKLQSVLKYHVVAGTVMAADLQDGQEVTTLQGEKLKVSIKDGVVMIGAAQVTAADIETSNGVVHTINAVLVPKTM